MDGLRWVFPGVKRWRQARGGGHVVLAVMPALKSKVIADAVGGGVDIYTNTALSLHGYRYNGPDPEDVLSPCPSDGVAAHDVKKLVAEVEEPANGPRPVNGPSSIWGAAPRGSIAVSPPAPPLATAIPPTG
jgi:hypothetical protein